MIRKAVEKDPEGRYQLANSMLEDLHRGVAPATIAARFHQGLALAVADTAVVLCHESGLDTVVLGGGVFQNRLLLEGVVGVLGRAGVRVLSPEKVPANDGGLAGVHRQGGLTLWHPDDGDFAGTAFNESGL